MYMWLLYMYFVLTHIQLATTEQKAAIFGVLGQVHISDAAEEDLKAGKEDIKVNKINLKLVCIHMHHIIHVCSVPYG